MKNHSEIFNTGVDSITLDIIGGGVMGCVLALEAAKLGGVNVRLYTDGQLFDGASGKNPGRAGLGCHYPDHEPTAHWYYDATMKVLRKFPEFIVLKDEPWGRGLYVVAKDSKVPLEKILQCYESLARKYAEEAEPILGSVSPEKTTSELGTERASQAASKPRFYRVLSREEWPSHINPESAEAVIETVEHLFDVRKFNQFIKNQLQEEKKIQVFEHTKLVSIFRGDLGEARFKLNFEQKIPGENQTKTLTQQSDYVANCTWGNAPAISSSIGLPMVTQQRRLKILARIKISEELSKKPSAFRLVGEYEMYTNAGDGTAYITYAKETNIDVSDALEFTPEQKRWMNGQIPYEERMEKGRKILRGAASLISDLTGDEEILEVLPGFVCTQGSLDFAELHARESSIARRDGSGVVPGQHGFVSALATKYFGFQHFVEETLALFKASFQLESWIKKTFQEEQAKLPPQLDLQKAYYDHLERYTPFDLEKGKNFLAQNHFFESFSLKQKLNEEIIKKGLIKSPVSKEELSEDVLKIFKQESVEKLTVHNPSCIINAHASFAKDTDEARSATVSSSGASDSEDDDLKEVEFVKAPSFNSQGSKPSVESPNRLWSFFRLSSPRTRTLSFNSACSQDSSEELSKSCGPGLNMHSQHK